jgi:anti-sigma factor RsiW
VVPIAQSKSGKRSQRLQLADAIPIVLRRQDGQRVPGKLQCVSVTGGLVVPASLLPPGSMVKLIFVTPKGPVTGTAEMLRPVSWTEQPFRFAAIADSDQHRLSAVIEMVYGQNGQST